MSEFQKCREDMEVQTCPRCWTDVMETDIAFSCDGQAGSFDGPVRCRASAVRGHRNRKVANAIWRAQRLTEDDPKDADTGILDNRSMSWSYFVLTFVTHREITCQQPWRSTMCQAGRCYFGNSD